MTQNIFNLYSAEAFAQHPMSLWSLDDDFSYVSLISASPVYNIIGGVSASVSNPPTEKPDETVGIADVFIQLDNFVGSASATTITTQNFTTTSDIDRNKPTACVSSFIYPYDTEISELEIGFQYENSMFVSIGNSLEPIILGNGLPSFTDGPSNLIALSTDAVTWTQGTLPESLLWYTISYGNNLFVVSARGTPGTIANRICVSTNGVTWTLFNFVFAGWDLIYKNNIFLGVVGGTSGVGSSDSNPYRSTDGITWTRPDTSFGPFASNWSNASYGNNNFVILSGMSNTNHAIYSTDNAETWQATTLPTSSEWETVSYGNNIFVALAYSSGGVSPAAISTNGVAWTATTAPPANWRSITYGNGIFVAITSGTLSSISTNGVTWTQTSLPNSSPFWRSIDYLKNVFVVQGNITNIILTSTNGVNWEQKTLPVNAMWRDTAYGDIYNSGDSSIYQNLELNSWKKITHTIDLPPLNTEMTPFINVKHPGSEKTYSLYQFSVGQWSEPFNHETQGIVPTPFSSISASSNLSLSIGGMLSASPSLFETKEADVYGLSEEYKGFYFIENKKMLSTNTKLPMVFGSGDITEIYPSEYGIPSLVFPGRGFLHSNGKYKQITAEFWLKIYSESPTKTRIFGPVSSQDGLYVDKEFLTLRIGPYEKSYFINKWYRPMLIDIAYTENYVSVMINGDTVIEQRLVSRDVEFPSYQTFDNDWLGFYSTEDILKFEIDCLAIYPYVVQDQSAKKKFIYGQGVGQADQVTRKFGAVSFPVDFSFSKYSQNIIYPDMTRWSSGFYSNIEADSKFLTLPSYALPEIKYSSENPSTFDVDRKRRTWQGVKSRTWEQWKSVIWRQLVSSREIEPLFDNYFFQENLENNFYIKLKPTSTYANAFGAIVFSSMNILSDPIKSLFGLFSLNTSEALEIESGTEATIMYFKNNSTGDVFKIIYNDSLKEIQYIYNSTTIKSISFVPGTTDTHFIVGFNIEDLTYSYFTIIKQFFSSPQNIEYRIGGNNKDQFTGKIYRSTFNNAFFTQKDMSDYFDEDGIALYNNSVILNTSDDPFEYVGNYTLFFKKANTSLIMDVSSAGYWEDSIPLSSLGTYIIGSNGERNIYDLDIIQFNIDYPAPIFAESDFDLENNLKTYITLQRYEDVGAVRYGNYSIIKELDSKRYIDFENISTNIDITKFNIINETIIFAPKNIVDFNDAYITIHMEMKSPGINTSPIKLQRMSFASLAFDESTLYPLDSPTGQKIYPFTREGGSYINKAKNPFLIYKDSTPYLYLTGDSGIQVLPYEELEDVSSEYFRRGMSFPINQNRKEGYTMYGMHMWSFYNKSNIFLEREKMFSISYQNVRYDFYLEPEVGGKRAKIVPYLYGSISDTLAENIVMFQNGIKQEVYIYPLSWSLISLRFEEPVSLNSIRGQLEIYSGTVFNNITIFEQDIEKKVDDIFESHFGLSNIVSQDSSTLSVNFDEVNIFDDILFTTFTGKPI